MMAAQGYNRRPITAEEWASGAREGMAAEQANLRAVAEADRELLGPHDAAPGPALSVVEAYAWASQERAEARREVERQERADGRIVAGILAGLLAVDALAFYGLLEAFRLV